MLSRESKAIVEPEEKPVRRIIPLEDGNSYLAIEHGQRSAKLWSRISQDQRVLRKTFPSEDLLGLLPLAEIKSEIKLANVSATFIDTLSGGQLLFFVHYMDHSSFISLSFAYIFNPRNGSEIVFKIQGEILGEVDANHIAVISLRRSGPYSIQIWNILTQKLHNHCHITGEGNDNIANSRNRTMRSDEKCIFIAYSTADYLVLNGGVILNKARLLSAPEIVVNKDWIIDSRERGVINKNRFVFLGVHERDGRIRLDFFVSFDPSKKIGEKGVHCIPCGLTCMPIQRFCLSNNLLLLFIKKYEDAYFDVEKGTDVETFAIEVYDVIELRKIATLDTDLNDCAFVQLLVDETILIMGTTGAEIWNFREKKKVESIPLLKDFHHIVFPDGSIASFESHEQPIPSFIVPDHLKKFQRDVTKELLVKTQFPVGLGDLTTQYLGFFPPSVPARISPSSEKSTKTLR